MQAKREREKELMFRGQEYARAIQKYKNKFGVYPSSVDQLIQTNGFRFLRKLYKDPITGKDFRLIRINPDGSLAGSKLFVQNVNTRPLFGNTQTFGQPPQQQTSPQSGMQQQGSPQFGTQQQGSPQSPQSQQVGQQSTTPVTPQTSQTSAQSFGQTQTQPGALPGFSPIGNAGATTISGGEVVGVASDSDEASVMVYNQRQKYTEWEFMAISGQSGPQGQLPGTQGPGLGGVNGQPPIPGTQGPGLGGVNGQPPGNPFSGQSPFGSQQGASPFGPAPGAQTGQQPFSPTNPAMPSSPFMPNTPGKLP
jgi:hypothetical protein